MLSKRIFHVICSIAAGLVVFGTAAQAHAFTSSGSNMPKYTVLSTWEEGTELSKEGNSIHYSILSTENIEDEEFEFLPGPWGILQISGNGSLQDYSGGNPDFDYSRNPSGHQSPWSHYNNRISFVNISSGITSIGKGVFYRFDANEYYIPDTVANISDYAFSDCYGLQKVVIHGKSTTISENAFAGARTYQMTIWCRSGSNAMKYAKSHDINYHLIDCPHTETRWEVLSKPTCTAKGKKQKVCCNEHCKKVLSTKTIAAAHIWKKWTTTKKATVFKASRQERVCSVCGKKQSRTQGGKLKPVLKLSRTSLTLRRGKSSTALKVTKMARGDSVASWKSSNKTVVKVSKTGKVTAGKKKGKAMVTVRLASGKSAKIDIKVK